MDISILIPMYNSENYIARCLESILNQGIPEQDYEIIIIDDGSEDGSIKIVKSFIETHPNIKLYSQENTGAYSTRNRLLEMAKGTYIYGVDADDYLNNNCLKKLVDFAKTHQLDVLGFDVQKTYKRDTVDLKIPIEKVNNPKITDGFTFLKKNPNHRVEIWWYLVKREFLNTNRMRFGKNEHNADVLFTLEVFLKAKRIAYFPVVVYHYFQSEDSIMRGESLEKRKRYVRFFHLMIVDFSFLINKLTKESFPHRDQILKNFRQRRDYFLFFLIFKMIKCEPITSIKSKLNQLNQLGAYPITNKIGIKPISVRFRILNFIVNKKTIIYLITVGYNFLYKIKRPGSDQPK